jgi:flagellar biosynthesis protein FliR
VTAAAAAALGAARALPLTFIAPPFGAATSGVRLLVAAVLVLMSWPALSAVPPPPLYAAALARELAVGMTLGLVAAIPFRAAEAAGALVDDALWPGRTRPFADAYLLLALALFAALDGPRLVALGWGQSYLAFPVGAVPSASAGLHAAVEAGARLVVAAAALAAPILGALLVADLVAGLIARAHPPLAVVPVAPIRIATALVLALVGLTTVSGAVALLGKDARGLGQALVDAARALTPPSR